MKKFFEYVGITVLCLFSYYYTDKLTETLSDKDTIMVFLEEKDKSLVSKCTEGYHTSDGVVLGITGLSVNFEKSYDNMKGLGYNEELIEYNKNTCNINKENSLDKYIIKGNPFKGSVSLIIEVSDFKYIESFLEIAKEKNIELSLLINDYIFNNYKDKILSYKVDTLFSGTNIRDFIVVFPNTFCVNNDINECSKNKINSIKIDKVYTEDALLNIKKSLEKGDLIILKENKTNLTELSSIINYINSKGIKIINVHTHLE